jgi:hypothetical protein
MAVFRNALQERYPDEIIMVRPNSSSLRLVAFKKVDEGPRWEDCVETHSIPLGIMLPGYVTPNRIELPESAIQHANAGNSSGTSQAVMVTQCA